jgi:hypothetical protein
MAEVHLRLSRPVRQRHVHFLGRSLQFSDSLLDDRVAPGKPLPLQHSPDLLGGVPLRPVDVPVLLENLPDAIAIGIDLRLPGRVF